MARTIIEQLAAAEQALDRVATRTSDDADADSQLRQMYLDDADDYRRLSAALESARHALETAFELTRNMDTAARDGIPPAAFRFCGLASLDGSARRL